MKRQRSVEVVHPRKEDTGVSIFEKLPPEVLTLIIGGFDSVSLWRFCACSSKARWFLLTHYDIFSTIHETLVKMPSLASIVQPYALWGFSRNNQHVYTVKHQFAVWYTLKYRAMMSSKDFGSRPDAIAFNIIALSVHKAFYVATHQFVDLHPLRDLCEIDYTQYGREQGPNGEPLDPIVFRLCRARHTPSLIKKYLNVDNCCVLVDYNMLSGIVKSIEYIEMPSRERYFALQREALGRNVINIRTVVVSHSISAIVRSGGSKEDVQREIEKVFTSAILRSRINCDVSPSIQKRLHQFYDCHINEIAMVEERSSSFTDSSLDDEDEDDSDTLSV